jgi:hypothetical protein
VLAGFSLGLLAGDTSARSGVKNQEQAFDRRLDASVAAGSIVIRGAQYKMISVADYLMGRPVVSAAPVTPPAACPKVTPKYIRHRPIYIENNPVFYNNMYPRRRYSR